MGDRDAEFVDLRPRAWADAFPWIPGKATDDVAEQSAWWDTPIDDADAGTRDAIVGRVASLAIDRLSKWTIGEAFPGLPGHVPFATLDLPVRAMNVLAREQLVITGDLADVRVEDLLGYRNAGVGTVTAILRQLASLSMPFPQATVAAGAPPEPEVAPPTDWLDDLLRDLEALAQWQRSIGHTDRTVLATLPAGAPDSVVAARDRVLGLRAAEIVPTDGGDVADDLDAVISTMNERYLTILAKRLFAWQPSTLDELGQEFGVTRERVRQLEVKARSELTELLSGDTGVGRVARLMRAHIRGVCPLNELLAEAPALEVAVRSVGQPAWRVIDVLDDAYEIVDGWCVKPSLEAAKRNTSVSLDESANEYGVVRLAEVSLGSSDDLGTSTWLAEWLDYLGYALRDQYVLLKTGSLNEIAAALLSIEGAPLKLAELHARISRGSESSLRNQLHSDPTFHRVDREHWALSTWGMESYTNIRVEIGKLLERAGGELPLAAVVESLVERFGVSASSVAVYASNAPYQVWNGTVRARSDKIAGGGRNPAKVQGYYRRGVDWLYRTTVTHDHLRGSGWPASTALATILGIGPGERAVLPSRLGDQNFTYKGHQPAYGSIKRFLEDLDLSVGDEIFCLFRGGGTFDVERLPEVPDDDMGRALRLVGADTNSSVDEAVEALGAAIKFAPGADVASIAEGYRARREQQIHDLIIGVDSQ